MRKIFYMIMVLTIGACVSTTGTDGSSGSLTSRPDADIARDAGRQPEAVLDFLGVAEGMTVFDALAAGGYYTEVLANRVGPDGRVYAQNPTFVLRYGNGRNDRALTDRLAGDRLPNVRRLDREFQDLGVLADSVDVAITALNFHDIYNNSPEAAAAVLKSLHYVLKPGGVLGIIDHVGNKGADNKALHRIDPTLAISAAEAAGFVVEISDVLANAEDDHSQGPFAEGLRGKTDRFVLKLTKP